MQKKLIVLAVAGALGVPLAAFAQQSGLTIYGRANMGVDRYTATGASDSTGNYASRTRIFDSGSRLGFRGSENLGGGMEAYFVLETGVNWDSGRGFGQSGVNNGASSGFPATRDSFAGIRASWGEFSFGRQSIFWANGLNAQSGANYINASADGMLTGNQLVSAPATRQSNVVYYTSPRMAGFDVAFAFSPDTQEAGTGTSGYTGTGQSKGSVWGLNLKYRMGPLYVQADMATNKNKLNTEGVTDKGQKLGASYGYAPGSRVGIIWQRLQNEHITAATATGTAAKPDDLVKVTQGSNAVPALVPAALGARAGDSPKVTMIGVNWEHMVGSTQLLAGYFRGSEVKGFSGGSAGTKSTAYHIGAKQMLSKRTGAYVSYNAIKNEANAIADLTGGGYTSAAGGPANAGMGAASAGADPKVIAVGLMHNF